MTNEANEKDTAILAMIERAMAESIKILRSEDMRREELDNLRKNMDAVQKENLRLKQAMSKLAMASNYSICAVDKGTMIIGWVPVADDALTPWGYAARQLEGVEHG